MPELSRFLGLVIAMYYRDHGPAHFHAVYGEFEVTVEIETGKVNGQFPKRASALVREWNALHKAELLANWERARRKEPLTPIEPLE